MSIHAHRAGNRWIVPLFPTTGVPRTCIDIGTLGRLNGLGTRNKRLKSCYNQ